MEKIKRIPKAATEVREPFKRTQTPKNEEKLS